ncbi:TPA: hypothetical protein HA270_01695 [Candidatus Woesearchaeota archaeon]|nr:hypothetical protein [Candidatus Woesearchaeota archaeon]
MEQQPNEGIFSLFNGEHTHQQSSKQEGMAPKQDASFNGIFAEAGIEQTGQRGDEPPARGQDESYEDPDEKGGTPKIELY